MKDLSQKADAYPVLSLKNRKAYIGSYYFC